MGLKTRKQVVEGCGFAGLEQLFAALPGEYAYRKRRAEELAKESRALDEEPAGDQARQ